MTSEGSPKRGADPAPSDLPDVSPRRAAAEAVAVGGAVTNSRWWGPVGVVAIAVLALGMLFGPLLWSRLDAASQNPQKGVPVAEPEFGSSMNPIPSATPVATAIPAPSEAKPVPTEKKSAPATKTAPTKTPRPPQSKAQPVKTASNLWYVNFDANWRSCPDKDRCLIGPLKPGTPVAVTGRQGDWRSIRYRGRSGWIWFSFVQPNNPNGDRGRVPTGECGARGANMQNKSADVMRTNSAVCNTFKQVRLIAPGQNTIEALVPNAATGWQVANYVKANAGRLGVSQIFFADSSWTRGQSNWVKGSTRYSGRVRVEVYGTRGSG